jgi:hypothetical protein
MTMTSDLVADEIMWALTMKTTRAHHRLALAHRGLLLAAPAPPGCGAICPRSLSVDTLLQHNTPSL